MINLGESIYWKNQSKSFTFATNRSVNNNFELLLLKNDRILKRLDNN